MAHLDRLRYRESMTHYLFYGPCILCKQPQDVAVVKAELYKYRRGALIQNAMPNLSAAEREFLISGICDNCFPKGEEEND